MSWGWEITIQKRRSDIKASVHLNVPFSSLYVYFYFGKAEVKGHIRFNLQHVTVTVVVATVNGSYGIVVEVW